MTDQPIQPPQPPQQALPPSAPKRRFTKKRIAVGGAITVGVLVVLSALGSPGGQRGFQDGLAAGLATPVAQTPEPTSGTTAAAQASEPTPETSAAAQTPEPTLEPTAEPTPEPTAAASIIKTAGRGDKVVKLVAQDAPTVAKITGKGAGNFAVQAYAGSEYVDLLVNEIGAFSGSVYVPAGVNRLKVTSSGSWTIQVRPITSARSWDGTSALAGKGDSVINLTTGASAITTIKNKSSSNFAVQAYSQDGEYLDLLVNEIGSYKGEVMLPEADPMVLVIQAVGGAWSFSALEQ